MECSPLATTPLSDQYEASWVDSFHNNTAIMFCTGNATENGFSVLGSFPDPNGGPDWGWRTEVELVDKDHLVITAYNISPKATKPKRQKQVDESEEITYRSERKQAHIMSRETQRKTWR